jgi:hypothetical protein
MRQGCKYACHQQIPMGCLYPWDLAEIPRGIKPRCKPSVINAG